MRASSIILCATFFIISTFFLIFPVHAQETLIDSFATPDTPQSLTVVHPSAIASFSAVGNSFNATIQSNLTRIRIPLLKVGAPTGNLSVYLYAHSETYGTNSTPTGAALIQSDSLNSSVLTGGFVWYDFNFSGYTLVLDTKYCFAVQIDSGIVNGTFYVQTRNKDATAHPGNYYTYNNTAWNPTITGADMGFYVYGDDLTPPTPTPAGEVLSESFIVAASVIMVVFIGVNLILIVELISNKLTSEEFIRIELAIIFLALLLLVLSGTVTQI